MMYASKTGDNTPTSFNDAKSNSSANSFSNVGVDNTESYLFTVIKQFEEAPQQQTKRDILKGNVLKLAFSQTGSRFL